MQIHRSARWRLWFIHLRSSICSSRCSLSVPTGTMRSKRSCARSTYTIPCTSATTPAARWRWSAGGTQRRRARGAAVSTTCRKARATSCSVRSSCSGGGPASGRGARLQLVKRIPSAAGLGGGSSDAAAALVAANLGWNLGLSRGNCPTVAAELGSDVPFFLAGGPAVCRGRGERVEPVAGVGRLHFVVVRPPRGSRPPPSMVSVGPPSRPRPLESLVESLQRGDVDGPAGCCTTDCSRPRKNFRPDRQAAASVRGRGLHGSRHEREWNARISGYFIMPHRHGGSPGDYGHVDLGHIVAARELSLIASAGKLRRIGRGNHRGSRQAHGGSRESDSRLFARSRSTMRSLSAI